MDLLAAIPLVPALGFLVLALAGPRLSRRAAGVVGAGSVGVALGLAVVTGVAFLSSRGPGGVFRQQLYTWVAVEGLEASFAFLLDSLSLVMVGVVTLVGFLIHLYAVQSMRREAGIARFFAYMNLFVAFMLVLVLADNLFLLLLGWEGVGLCSYLLIGYWFHERPNGVAAQKAFIVTRIGDVALLIALAILLASFGTLDVRAILRAAPGAWAPGSALATTVAFLLLGGAIGKSAQAPLHVWLPDAMAGPTPVSALIHAATMVTAGVYLIARLHPLFALAPVALAAVAMVGAATALYAATAALAQRDIKRVLAYSTISQIGFMFLALGVGAWGAAIFHLFTHAFFKALLFLGAGVVIDALDHEHDIFRMGGLRRRLPLTFWTFVAGAAALSAVPLVTAGFFSKDAILWFTWASPAGGTALWAVAVATAVLTGLYSTRLVMLVFLGEGTREVHERPGALMQGSLTVLAAGSIVAGYLGLPEILGGWNPFGRLLDPVLPAPALDASRAGHTTEIVLFVASAVASLAGIGLGVLYFRQRHRWERTGAWRTAGVPVARFLAAGWGFDAVYRTLVVRPYQAFARANAGDVFDTLFGWLARGAAVASRLAAATETGRVRTYAAGVLAGAILLGALLLTI